MSNVKRSKHKIERGAQNADSTRSIKVWASNKRNRNDVQTFKINVQNKTLK